MSERKESGESIREIETYHKDRAYPEPYRNSLNVSVSCQFHHANETEQDNERGRAANELSNW
jgi:hypothetical protein